MTQRKATSVSKVSSQRVVTLPQVCTLLEGEAAILDGHRPSAGDAYRVEVKAKAERAAKRRRDSEKASQAGSQGTGSDTTCTTNTRFTFPTCQIPAENTLPLLCMVITQMEALRSLSILSVVIVADATWLRHMGVLLSGSSANPASTDCDALHGEAPSNSFVP